MILPYPLHNHYNYQNQDINTISFNTIIESSDFSYISSVVPITFVNQKKLIPTFIL